jgi:signal transduction histidine kinase
VEQLTALIISDDAEFSNLITARWQSERGVPGFTLMNGDVHLGFDPDNFQLAVVGHLRPQVLPVVLETLTAADKRVLFVSEEVGTLQTVRERWPGTVVLRQRENWLDTLVLVGAELLYRALAEARMRSAETSNAALQHEATLGRYVLEMRHTLSNTLTAMLGNSELLLLEPGSLSAESRSQIETIRNMALRIHEILQRFSSLEKELSVSGWEARKRPANRSHAAAV